MNPLLPLLAELTLLVGASSAVAYVGQKYFNVVPAVGFLVAGAVIGPNAAGLVSDPHFVELAAEIGVILLLFTVGIEFSLERLARIRRLIFGGGSLQLFLTGGAVTGVMLLLGVSGRDAVYTGMLATLSSTVIVLKMLGDQGRTATEEGQAALGILLFQDLAVIVMVLLLPALSGQSAGLGVVRALAEAGAIIVLVLVIARRLMPLLLERVAQVCSQDVFLLAIIAICFGTAWLAALAGVGVSLGAFLAGLIVSESRFSAHALSEILPLRILFSAAFFVSVGMLLDPAFLLAQPWLVLGVVAAILVIKTVTTAAGLFALGASASVALPAAFLLAQVGEFAFVLERSGAALGLAPAGLPEVGAQTFIAATVILMIGTPAYASLGPRLSRRWQARSRSAAADVGPGAERAEHSGHVVIAGYGPAGRRLARYVSATENDLTIVTLDPSGAREAEAEGLHVVRGDYSRQQILAHVGMERARLFIVADDDASTSERVIGVVKGLYPDVRVIAQVDRLVEVEPLVEAGADEVVAAEGSADRELAQHVLQAIGTTPSEAALIVSGVDPDGPGIQLDEAARRSTSCPHAAHVGPVQPRTPGGCEECLAKGERWVHLRVCMTCGHVGCCGDSPGTHAAAHYRETGHPIIRSWEPGEEWAWCYEDEVRL